ncbi:MAG: LLM class flavin-dependent oxidoreductase [Dehalococcoidia bacterium]
MRRSVVLILDAIDEMVEYARLAEDAGFEAAWITDFYNRDAFVRMAMVARATKRIGVASGIAYAFARSPVLTAAAAADVDEISGGRVVLGLGTGTKRMQESWYGLTFESPAPKAAEVVRLLRALWSAPGGRPFRFEGRFYNLAIDFFGRPGRVRSDIPVYLAGVNRRMVRTAGEVADGLVGHPLYSRRYIEEAVRPAVDDGLQRSGRERAAFDLAGYVITSIAPDREQAREEARRQIAFYATTLTYDAILDLHGWQAEKEGIRAAWKKLDVPAMSAAVSDAMLDQISVAGTPDDCRQQLARYEGLLDHALLYPPSFGTRPERVKENYRLIAETFGPAHTEGGA